METIIGKRRSRKSTASFIAMLNGAGAEVIHATPNSGMARMAYISFVDFLKRIRLPREQYVADGNRMTVSLCTTGYGERTVRFVSIRHLLSLVKTRRNTKIYIDELQLCTSALLGDVELVTIDSENATFLEDRRT